MDLQGTQGEPVEQEVTSNTALNITLIKELLEFVRETKPDKDALAKMKVVLCRKHNAKRIPSDIEILLHAPQEELSFFRKYLKTKPMRTASGVAVIAIMSAPYGCPHGKCIYCPGGPGSFFGDVPQSYTGHEPSTMRGIRNNYDAYLMVMNRLEQYIAIGQSPDKVELIIMGGTFPSYPESYQEQFVRDAFQAMNDFSEIFYQGDSEGFEDLDIEKFKEFFQLPGRLDDSARTITIRKKLLELKFKRQKSLEECQSDNEHSRIRCVGLTIETKPDWGLLKEGNRLLKLGCTRVELGVQTLYDAVLKETHRGHTLQDTRDSIRILKDLGFKLNFHMMPGLPGVSLEKDVGCYERLFSEEDWRPDMLKIYPTLVMPGTKLFLDYKQGKFVPYSTEQAAEVISEAAKYIPRYCRLMRVQRDIPSKFSSAGVSKNNLRQLVDARMREKGYVLQDIRAREIRLEKAVAPLDFEIIEYAASGGKEFFISLVDSNDRLLGFARLRFPSANLRKEFNGNTAMIRELHVYGQAAVVGAGEENAQHRGFGKKLMQKAEELAVKNGYLKMLVISGIGVRGYYKMLGYSLEGPYMSKFLDGTEGFNGLVR